MSGDITANLTNTNISANINNNVNLGINVLGYSSGGVTNFWEMNDTPNSYIGFAENFLLVNNSQNGIKFAQTVPISAVNNLQSILDSKVDIDGYVATDNNYTNAEKSKLVGIQDGAEVNVNSDWNAITGDAQILNKPDIPNIARQSISETAEGLTYTNATGVLSLTNGYIIPTLTNFNNKVDKESGKGLSENNFTDILKSKLDGIEAGAQVNTVTSVNSKTGTINLTTNDISENTNLYYTNARADARITTQKGAVNGIASLDATGKVPSEQLPPMSGGGIIPKGTWDASTGNYPTETPNNSEFWVINVAGTIDGTSYSIGDWIIYYTEYGWNKVPSGNAVTSVNSKTGTVILTTTDIAEGINEYYTDIKVSANSDVTKGVSAHTWGNHALAGYANDLSVVHKLGNETIYGNKTFDDTLHVNDRLNVGSNTFDITNPEFLKVDGGNSSSVNIISGYSDYDDYVQLNIKNRNDGISASSDFVATADIGQEGANYIDLGINNSNYSNEEFTITEALDGYCFVDGGNLAIGTASPDKKIILFTGGTLQENKRAELTDTSFTINVDIDAPNLVVTTTTINGYSLANNINLSKTDIGLGSVDNTSDLNKPISTATQTELQKIKNLAIAMAVAL